jgi:geranylgeranyl diphosphate synthase type II
MFDLPSYIDKNRIIINEMLINCFDGALRQRRIVRAMQYSLMAEGKRLRPILCIAAAEAVGPVSDDVYTVACAIEMVHTYSLIHDDLPSMDNDDLRRGKPTCHIEFDEATAILAGDALLTMAFQVLSSIKTKNKPDAYKYLKVIHIISTASGYQGMIEGQMRDMAYEGIKLNMDELEGLHRLKTGCLIEASVISGALLNGGNDNQIDRLKVYANNIGLAFQISDDILDIKGNPITMGKNTGSDKNRKKNTYPSLLGIEKSRSLSKKLITNALKALDIFDKRSDPLRQLAEYVIKRKK